jgi:hypothetical protein
MVGILSGTSGVSRNGARLMVSKACWLAFALPTLTGEKHCFSSRHHPARHN